MRCSITSRNSQPGSVSAPSADPHHRRRCARNSSKNFRHSRITSHTASCGFSCVQPADRLAKTCDRRAQLTTVHSFGRRSAQLCTVHPQPHATVACKDSGSSPECTAPNTVTDISPRFLLKNRSLGTQRCTARRTRSGADLSAVRISFQDADESSTVGLRPRLRSSWRGKGRLDVTGGSRWSGNCWVW